MSPANTLERARAALQGISATEVESRDEIPCLEIERGAVHDVLERLRDRAGFSCSTLVTVVDHLPEEPRFRMVYQLLSIEFGDRIRIETRLPAEDPTVASCSDLWPGASFSERECFDMFGIRFEGLANHERLLMPTGYGHHPLRKDFPHEGIEPDRLYREWDRERRASERSAGQAVRES